MKFLRVSIENYFTHETNYHERDSKSMSKEIMEYIHIYEKLLNTVQNYFGVIKLVVCVNMHIVYGSFKTDHGCIKKSV